MVILRNARPDGTGKREIIRKEAESSASCNQELFKVAIRSFGKPLKRFEVCAISKFLAMNREANENEDNRRHPPICYFDQFLIQQLLPLNFVCDYGTIA